MVSRLVCLISLLLLFVSPCSGQEISPDLIAASCRKGNECLKAWDLTGAKQEFLRSVYLIQDVFQGKHVRPEPFEAMGRLYLLFGWDYLAFRYFRSAGEYRSAGEAKDGSLEELKKIAAALHFRDRAFRDDQRGDISSEAEIPEDLAQVFKAFTKDGGKTDSVVKAFMVTYLDLARKILEKDPAGFHLAMRVLDIGYANLPEAAAVDRMDQTRIVVHFMDTLFEECRKNALKMYDEAARELDAKKTREGIPDHAGLAFLLGEVHRMKWRRSKDIQAGQRAVACYQAAHAGDPEYGISVHGLTEVLLGLGKTEEAAVAFQSAANHLLDPALPWRGEPEVPPAPRLSYVTELQDYFLRNARKTVDRDFRKNLSLSMNEALLMAYRDRRGFHPDETRYQEYGMDVLWANNVGFFLLTKWELTRAREEFHRCIQLNKSAKKSRSLPLACMNLGHLSYLQGDFDRALEYFRKAIAQDSKNPVTANNLGALMGIFGSITMNQDMIREGLGYYQRAVELAPQYVFASASVKFMRNVWITWDRYLNQKIRHPLVVQSFGNSFLYSARSISESDDPGYLQAMQILDSGLRNMPTDEEMEKIFKEGAIAANIEKIGGVEKLPDGAELEGAREVKKIMADLFESCLKKGLDKYEKLLGQYAGNEQATPTLRFLLGEVCRIGWRRKGDAKLRDRAEDCYRKVLALEADHGGAARGLTEVLCSTGKEAEAMAVLDSVVRALLEPRRPWQGEPEAQPVPRSREAMALAQKAVKAAGDEGKSKTWRAFLRRTYEAALQAQKDHAESSMKGKDPEAWNNLAYLEVLAAEALEEPDRLNRALEHLDYALALESLRPGPTLNKIHVLQKLGRNEEAEALKKKAAERHPDDQRFKPVK